MHRLAARASWLVRAHAFTATVHILAGAAQAAASSLMSRCVTKISYKSPQPHRGEPVGGNHELKCSMLDQQSRTSAQIAWPPCMKHGMPTLTYRAPW